MIIKFRSAKYDKQAHGGYKAGADFAFTVTLQSIVSVGVNIVDALFKPAGRNLIMTGVGRTKIFKGVARRKIFKEI